MARWRTGSAGRRVRELAVRLTPVVGLVVLLGGCDGRKSPESGANLPACPAPVTEGFDPVWESELRFDATTAAWTGDLVASTSGTAEAFAGSGASSTELQLNRGNTYTAVGTLASDVPATVSLIETAEDDALVTLASWTVAADAPPTVMNEPITIAANARTFHMATTLSSPGTAQVSLQLTGTQWADDPTARAASPIQLGFLMHIEDTGALVADETIWNRRAEVVAALSQVLAAHGAMLTLQPGESFVAGEAVWSPGWVSDREAEGMTWSVHVHNESDGATALEKSVRNSVQNYKAVGVDVKDLNGGFSLGIWKTLATSGLESITAFKNPDTQLDLARPHVQPWRPADGTGAGDEEAFGTNDPAGPMIYLPGSGVRDADHTRYSNFVQRHLAQARAHAKAGYVNTWYFIEHVDGFGPDAATDAFDTYVSDGGLAADMAQIDAGLTSVIDPLVASGEVVYSNPDAMRQQFQGWEQGCVMPSD